MAQTFKELIDIPKLQSLMDIQYAATGIPIGIIDIDGTIHVATGWQDICTQFHRIHPKTARLCCESDNYITRHLHDGRPVEYRCKNGLWDIAMPIYIKGKHIATLFVGQFHYENEVPDRDFFSRQAQAHGFNREKYMAALDRLPVFSRSKMKHIIAYYSHFVDYLIEIGLNRIEREEAFDRLDKSEKRFSLTMATVGEGLWDWNIQTNEVYYSPNYFGMLGYPPGEKPIGSSTWQNLIHPHDRPNVLKTNQDCIENRLEKFEFDFRMKAKNGEWLWIHARGSAVARGDNGRALRIIGTHTNITEHKRAEIERNKLESSLQESRQFLSDVFDFLPDATFVVDRKKTVIAWNKAMEEMSGVAKEEMLGQGDHAYTIPFYGDRRIQFVDLLDVDEMELSTEYKGITRAGERLFAETFCPKLNNGKGGYVWAVMAPLYNSKGTRIGAIGSIRDISVIKETEENLARSNQELERFAYIASHDLQEPLRKVGSYMELVAERYRDQLDQDAREFIDYAVDGARRMKVMIDDLLIYSRVGTKSKTFAAIDMMDVMEDVLNDLELAIKENNAVVAYDALPVVMADASQLQQLFRNLIGNALKYRGPDPPQIRVSAQRQEQAWRVCVKDNGIGIEPRFFERIFQIFQRLHPPGQFNGTGIGLAVCKKIVERHGGTIGVESTPEKGSTFYFIIPDLKEQI